jgi:hypothetical protein
VDFVTRQAHRTEQGYYCHACFAGMLSDLTEATSSTKELEQDVDLLGALEDALPENGLPDVDAHNLDPQAKTVVAPAPGSEKPSKSTIMSVAEELGPEEPAPPKPERPAGERPAARDLPAPEAARSSSQYILVAAVTIAILTIALAVLFWGR